MSKEAKSRLAEDMAPRFPGDDIRCKDCAMRNPGMIGFKNRYCECYPEGKPLDILFENAECDYYLEEL